MNTEFYDPPSPLDIEQLLIDATKQIIKDEDPVKFLQWIQEHIADYDTNESDEIERSRHTYTALAATIGRSLWNAMPLPSNDFIPRPLPSPELNDMCFCGSGNKFKHCCANIPDIPAMTSEELWPILAPLLSKPQLTNAIKAQQIPIASLIEIAATYGEQKHTRKGISLIEPLFEQVINEADERYEFALNTLCNLYDDAGFENKKLKLLHKIIDTAPRSPLRAGAWQRIAVICLDLNDPKEAWDAFHHAQRDNPDAIDIGILEVQLLIGENKIVQAQERAKFWTKRLQRQGLMDDEPTLRFLTAVIENPLHAMGQASLHILGESEQQLYRWLEKATPRALPTDSYIIPQPNSTELTSVDKRTDAKPHDNIGPSILVTPNNLIALEKDWHNCFHLEPPFASNNTPLDNHDIWSNQHTKQWLAFLENHPEAFDSLTILDDLASALAVHEQNDTPWLDDMLLTPLLERTKCLLTQTLSSSLPLRLSWFIEENRPALRGLVRLSYLYSRQENINALSEVNALLLNLNPEDNHGIRMDQMNNYLKLGDNINALNLANSYLEDMHPETLYGKVLALVRLNRLDEAQDAVTIAIERLPKIVRFLTHKRVKQPKVDYNQITLGGDDQAWIYRDDMRLEWEKTPDSLTWLKKQARKLPI